MFTKDSELPDRRRIPGKQPPDPIISACIWLEGGGFRGRNPSGWRDGLRGRGFIFS